jgi:L-alanine-DL-glutamate epimerase-like enolase superfamily enzyme
VELRVTTRTLELAEAFGIARGSRTSQTVVQVELEHAGIVGRGEASAVYYRGESVDAVVDFLGMTAPPLVGDDPFALEDIEERLEDVDGLSGGKSALDGALHDWIGKRLGMPLWRLLGLWPRAPHTSFTIGIDTVEGTRERVRRAQEFRALKVKVGSAEDLERLEAVREEAPDAAVRVDANEGWTLDSARALMPELIRLGVEFVEQPFPAADLDSFMAFRDVEPRLPIVVDEGCQNLADVAPAAAYADGINVKLAKSGGVREAVRMIHAARALGLHVMIGCMVESQLGVAPAAALASLADWVDLDGHLLLADQPFTGLRFEDGRVLPSAEPGLGVAPA